MVKVPFAFYVSPYVSFREMYKTETIAERSNLENALIDERI